MPQIPRIFTGISISLSLCWRQQGSRYVIHAGRNLPDKEFRYLWTVIVTAAVYWGLDQMLLKHPNFTYQHRADVRLYTSSYDFAESCVFDKQSLPSFQLHLDLVTQIRLCFSRSYTYNLPSSFSTIISYTLVYSTQPPVLVFGTIKISKLFPVNILGANINPIRHNTLLVKSLGKGSRILTWLPSAMRFRFTLGIG